jgi:hypothetical protein
VKGDESEGTNEDNGLYGCVGCIVKSTVGGLPINLGLENSEVGMSLTEANDDMDVSK